MPNNTITWKQQRRGAWHDEPLIVTNKILLHKDKRNKKIILRPNRKTKQDPSLEKSWGELVEVRYINSNDLVEVIKKYSMQIGGSKPP